MMIKEFRIPMPLSLAEYHIAQLYTMMDVAKAETGGGDGVEEIQNEPFENLRLGGFGIKSGQYTLKKLHMDHKLPAFLRFLTPKGCLHLQEESWNAFPCCRTILTNEFLQDRLLITVESIHLPDRGDTPNALNLPPDKLLQREIVFLDIAKDFGDEKSSVSSGKLHGYKSLKANRGPLQPNWFTNYEPTITCYKLVILEVKIFGLQNRLESFILNQQKKLFLGFHRKMFQLMDTWYGLTLEEIRRMERENAQELEAQRKCGELRGTSAND